MVVCLAGPPIPVPLFPVPMLEDLATDLGPAMPLCIPAQVAGSSREHFFISFQKFASLMNNVINYKVSKKSPIDKALYNMTNHVIYTYLHSIKLLHNNDQIKYAKQGYVSKDSIMKYVRALNLHVSNNSIIQLQNKIDDYLQQFVLHAEQLKKNMVMNS